MMHGKPLTTKLYATLSWVTKNKICYIERCLFGSFVVLNVDLRKKNLYQIVPKCICM